MEGLDLLKPAVGRHVRRPALRLATAVVLLAALAWCWRYLPPTGQGALPVPPAVLAQLRAGDLVFRAGTEPISDSVRLVDGGGFSHVGLLVGRPGHWQVVHAMPDGHDGRGDGVVVDGLAYFLDRTRSRRAGFFRVQATQGIRRAAVAWARTQIGTPFRIEPAAASLASGGTYCTLLIDRAYARAGLDLQVHFRAVHLPLIPGEYLLPSALRDSPRLHLIHDTAAASAG